MNAFKAFLNLDISEIIIADIEEFTCHMYDNPKNKCLNGVLKANFDKKMQSKTMKEFSGFN